MINSFSSGQGSTLASSITWLVLNVVVDKLCDVQLQERASVTGYLMLSKQMKSATIFTRVVPAITPNLNCSLTNLPP